MTRRKESSDKLPRPERRTLRLDEWPPADRLAWDEACRPGQRLRRGGAASHLNRVSQETLEERYGIFLGFLKQSGRFDLAAPATAHVTPENIKAYLADIEPRLASMTVLNCIRHARRLAVLIAPSIDFAWLAEIEKDLELVAEPRSKFDRLVFTERLYAAGLTLMIEAKQSAKTEHARAVGHRNGLMIALLALDQVRLKNFAALEIGKTFRLIRGQWWITIPRNETKTRRKPEERPVDPNLTPHIEEYLTWYRPILLRTQTNALWITRSGTAMEYGSVSRLVGDLTLQTLGVRISPHLFRTSAVSTAEAHLSDMPHLASALLGHSDPRITEQDYNRTSSISAGRMLADVVEQIGGDLKNRPENAQPQPD